MIAALIAAAAFAGGTPPTTAVEPAPATPALEASEAVGDNAASSYFPGQFADVTADVMPRVESF